MDNVKIFWQKSTNLSTPVRFRTTDTSYDTILFRSIYHIKLYVMVHTFPFNNISLLFIGELNKSSEWTISRRKPDLTTFHGSWFAAWPHL